MKVAVIGASGQLGRDVCAVFAAAGHDVAALDHSRLEISSLEGVRDCLNSIRPGLVVNTAAFHHVEKCEADPSAAFAVNSVGARNVAEASDTLRAKLVHISTDYVFDGSKRAPYVEQDDASPLNVYGNSKLSGEHLVRVANSRHFVVRVSALYGRNPCRAKGGLNFVELMLKLAAERGDVRVVDDEMVTPTATTDVARQLLALSETTEYGLYHATAEGWCSWHEFARTIFALTRTTVRLEPARAGEFPAKVPRPKYSVLENQALKAKSLNIFRPWDQGLEEYLADRTLAGRRIDTSNTLSPAAVDRQH